MDLAPPTAPDDDEPSAARELANEVAGVVDAAIVEPLVGQAIAGVGFAIVAILLVPLGLAVLVLSFLALGGIFAIFGTPTGTLGSMFMVGWWIATAGVAFLVLRGGFRRLPRRLRTESTAHISPRASWTTGEEPTHARIDGLAVAEPRQSAAATLAELDARHAPAEVTPGRSPEAR